MNTVKLLKLHKMNYFLICICQNNIIVKPSKHKLHYYYKFHAESNKVVFYRKIDFIVSKATCLIQVMDHFYIKKRTISKTNIQSVLKLNWIYENIAINCSIIKEKPSPQNKRNKNYRKKY